MPENDVKSVIKNRYDIFARQDRIGGEIYKAKDGMGLIGQKLLNEDELSKIPHDALYYFMGATTPTRLVKINPGDTVLDLGCGVGVDIILAAHMTGPSGRVIGIDLSEGLIGRAREIVAQTGLKNIELIQGDMESIPLPHSSVDVVISNGAINLVPDKGAVFREAYRVLKPDGRLALGDIMLKRKIETDLLRRFREQLAGCLAFAVDEKEYLEAVCEAGFTQLKVVSSRPLSREELDVMVACPDVNITPPPRKEDVDVVEGLVISKKLTAVKKLH
ncbi:MAG: methyltransferase domain-containing protein [Bacillota bacterium]